MKKSKKHYIFWGYGNGILIDKRAMWEAALEGDVATAASILHEAGITKEDGEPVKVESIRASYEADALVGEHFRVDVYTLDDVGVWRPVNECSGDEEWSREPRSEFA